jgi:hypothetical protein
MIQISSRFQGIYRQLRRKETHQKRERSREKRKCIKDGRNKERLKE